MARKSNRKARKTHQDFLRSLAQDITRDAYQYAHPNVRKVSNTLAQFMKMEMVSEREGLIVSALSVPHYWAGILHFGRGPVSPQAASVLVWFRNPRDDPRYPGGVYPQRKSQIRKLTKGQWDFWVAQNRLARANNLPEPMIVRRWSGGTKPRPFFSNHPPDGGMAGFPKRAFGLAAAAARQHILETIGDNLHVKGTLRVVI